MQRKRDVQFMCCTWSGSVCLLWRGIVCFSSGVCEFRCLSNDPRISAGMLSNYSNGQTCNPGIKEQEKYTSSFLFRRLAEIKATVHLTRLWLH